MTTKVSSSVLSNTAVTPGTYGGATQIPFVTIDAQGRATAAGNTPLSVANTQLSASGTADSTTYLRGDNTWSQISIPTADSLGLGTANNVQHSSLGIGQAASGVAGEVKATTLYGNVSATSVTFGDSTVQNSASRKVKVASGTFSSVASFSQSCGTLQDYSELEIFFTCSKDTAINVNTNFVFRLYINGVERMFNARSQTIAGTATALSLNYVAGNSISLGNSVNNYTSSYVNQPYMTSLIKIVLPDLHSSMKNIGSLLQCTTWNPYYVYANAGASTALTTIVGTPDATYSDWSNISLSNTISFTIVQNNSYLVSGNYIVYGKKR